MTLVGYFVNFANSSLIISLSKLDSDRFANISIKFCVSFTVYFMTFSF